MYMIKGYDGLVNRQIIAYKDLSIARDILTIRFSCIVTNDKGIFFTNMTTTNDYENTEKKDSIATSIERYWFLSSAGTQGFLSTDGRIPMDEIRSYLEGYCERNRERLEQVQQIEAQMALLRQEMNEIEFHECREEQ